MNKMHISDDFSSLKQFNYSCLITLHLLRREKMFFHQTCIFPYNILVLAIDDDGSTETIFSCSVCGWRRRLQKGKFYFIPAGHRVEYDIRPNLYYYTFHFGFERLPNIDFFSVNDHCADGNADDMLSETESILQDSDAQRQACRLRAMLLNFALGQWGHQHPVFAAPDHRFSETLQYINKHCSATLTIAELAEHAGLCADVFSRKFKQIYGTLPKEYLSRLLVSKIIALLMDPSLSLKKVANMLQFSSEYYLSRFLKRRLGFSPGVYRNTFRTNFPAKHQMSCAKSDFAKASRKGR